MDRRGFTLVEAAVAIAVLAILAGMMAPLALRTLDQQREARTRRDLKLAFEAMFGARDRRVANMRSDYGFTVDGNLEALPEMVRQPVGTPHMGRHGDASFQWGWNGPYWYGPIVNGAPADAWGRPIKLRFEAHDNHSFQLYSTGPTGRFGAGNIDYPPVPVPLASLNTRVILHIYPSRPELACQIRIRYAQRVGVLAPLLETVPVPIGGRAVHATLVVPAGTMEVTIEPRVGVPEEQRGVMPRDFRAIPLDLLPGETREVSVPL